MPDEVRDPVNCAGCFRDWLREGRALFDAWETRMDASPPVVVATEHQAHELPLAEAAAAHGNGVAAH
jgi:hypothetical protein